MLPGNKELARSQLGIVIRCYLITSSMKSFNFLLSWNDNHIFTYHTIFLDIA